jgi:arginyl-tRNA--protein-N-Asp/Glu arginylyltransferase
VDSRRAPEFEQLPNLPLPLLRGAPHDCTYLPGREACQQYTFPELAFVDSELYERMMNTGFRRAGRVFYRPSCPTCTACVPIRVAIERFRPSRSQRRTISRNRDVTVRVGALLCDDEHYALYRSYQRARHEERAPADREGFNEFLGVSPIETVELSLRVGSRLLAVAIVDVCPTALSSVYCYYDPAESRRSPGVLAALFEIELCRVWSKSHWYIGFHIDGCRKMAYKRDYRPHELLGPDGLWHEPGVFDSTNSAGGHAGHSRAD